MRRLTLRTSPLSEPTSTSWWRRATGHCSSGWHGMRQAAMTSPATPADPMVPQCGFPRRVTSGPMQGWAWRATYSSPSSPATKTFPMQICGPWPGASPSKAWEGRPFLGGRGEWTLRMGPPVLQTGVYLAQMRDRLAKQSSTSVTSSTAWGSTTKKLWLCWARMRWVAATRTAPGTRGPGPAPRRPSPTNTSASFLRTLGR
mmetsp:Transcript_23855/g.32799  ORF Transcript_23855/g.32799 Transcript_23855/m.32799 type:complete len:201 (+) Transcript_23855:318-920(+)